MIKHHSIFFFFLILQLLAVGKSYSQPVKVTQDFRTRTALGVEKELLKNLTMKGETEIGFQKNASQLAKVFGEIALNYEIAKFLESEIAYRYTHNRKGYTDNFKQTHLFSASIEASKRIDQIKGFYRIQFQNDDEDFAVYEKSKKSENILKNRIKLNYKIRGTKLTPYVSSELYHAISEKLWDAQKIKWVAGINYSVRKTQDAKLYFRIDRELTPYIPYMYYTCGVSYNFSL